MFQWAAAAKRPLSLEKLREAVADVPGQPCFKPERLWSGMSRVTAWCEDLVVLDEKDDYPILASHVRQQRFHGPPSDQRLNRLHLQLSNIDYEVGEICVTYLNFNDFKA